MPDTAVAEATIEERVEAGAAHLDEHAPGWLDVMDLDHLDVSEPTCCPLGMICGHWAEAPDDVGYRADLGFYYATEWPGPIDELSNDEYMHAQRTTLAEYAALTDAWRALIERRRTEAGAA